MARKSESGIAYFPLNSDIITNTKVKLIVSEFGPKTYAVLIPLFCKIYREKGYWIDWNNEDLILLFAQDECKCDLSFVNEVVSRSVKRDLFSEILFNKFGILSSDRIQENYLEAKRRQKVVDLVDDFLLISENVYKLFQNVNIIDLDVNIITKKVDAGTQNRRRGRIKEEGEGDSADAQMYTQTENDLFKAFKAWIDKNASKVSKMKEPLSIKQFLKLKEDFPGQQKMIQEVLQAMHNNKTLLKKYESANLTLRSWIRLREDRNTGTTPVVRIPPNDEKAKAILNTAK